MLQFLIASLQSRIRVQDAVSKVNSGRNNGITGRMMGERWVREGIREGCLYKQPTFVEASLADAFPINIRLPD
jgi:hypothetical protein